MSFRPKIVTTYAKSLFQTVNNFSVYVIESDKLFSVFEEKEKELELELEKEEKISISQSTAQFPSQSLFEFIQKLEKKVEDSLNEGTGTKGKFDIDKLFSENGKQSENLVTLDVISIELNYLTSFITSSKELEILYSNPTVSEKKKLKVIFDLLPGLTGITSAFLKVLTEKTHLGLIPQITEEYDELLSKLRSFTKVKLITASVLEESYGLNLLNTLKNLTKSKRILLELSYNPKLLGGLILEYNSTSTDASILKEFSLFFNEI